MGKTIKLGTLFRVTTALVILITAFFIFLYGYWYNREKPVSLAPILSDFVRPRFLFNIYGAKGVKLIRPMSLFFDNKDKLIYISNTEGHSIDVFKWQGEYLYSFGKFGNEPGKLSFPYGVARTQMGNLLVAESGNCRIQRFSVKGDFLGTILSQPNEFKIEKPGPLIMDAKGNLYIGDLSGGKVVVLDEQGKIIRTFAPIQYPHGIAIDDKNGLVYIADGGAGEVKVYSLNPKNQRIIRTIAGCPSDSGEKPFGMVRGIAVDKVGNLFVVDSIACSVRVFDSKGKYKFSFGEPGNEDASMLYPNGIYIDDNNRIYIADWANNRIGVWGY